MSGDELQCIVQPARPSVLITPGVITFLRARHSY